MPARDENPDAAPNVAELPTPPEVSLLYPGIQAKGIAQECTKGVSDGLE
ncbi:MAG: hypothetical protein NTX48_08460 [Planctomycetales bacterium]|nr:hypothetical protein [Planctomycetales bacterium]